MKRVPSRLRRMAPSPRSASVASGAGIAADIDGRRVELDEFQIRDQCAGFPRHGDGIPARGRRIGGDLEQAA
jgi:hypothetical protein